MNACANVDLANKPFIQLDSPPLKASSNYEYARAWTDGLDLFTQVVVLFICLTEFLSRLSECKNLTERNLSQAGFLLSDDDMARYHQQRCRRAGKHQDNFESGKFRLADEKAYTISCKRQIFA